MLFDEGTHTNLEVLCHLIMAFLNGSCVTIYSLHCQTFSTLLLGALCMFENYEILQVLLFKFKESKKISYYC